MGTRIRIFCEDEIGMFLLTCKPKEFSDYKRYMKKQKYKCVGMQRITNENEPYDWSQKEVSVRHEEREEQDDEKRRDTE